MGIFFFRLPSALFGVPLCLGRLWSLWRQRSYLTLRKLSSCYETPLRIVVGKGLGEMLSAADLSGVLGNQAFYLFTS
jgi:hypothetical protein